MGKKGNIKLILPKNSGNKDWLEAAVKVVFESGGEIAGDPTRMSFTEDRRLTPQQVIEVESQMRGEGTQSREAVQARISGRRY